MSSTDAGKLASLDFLWSGVSMVNQTAIEVVVLAGGSAPRK